MEDVLEIYQRPQDAAAPVVCVDETSKQQIQETRQPLPIVEGLPSLTEYQRNGVSNLFMIFAPLQGFRHLTNARLLILRISAGIYRCSFPGGFTLVCDNLNTHKPAFPPDEARRIVEKLAFHYTPKHGNRWLNIAEIEFSVLSRQCLSRRIPDQETLKRERRGKTEEISNAPPSTGGLLTKRRVSNSKHYTQQFRLDRLLVVIAR